jgi:tRNA(Ile)-lysidine synthase
MMMDLLNAFRYFIDKENLFSRSDKLLLAVSGGADSIVLCELCQQAGFDFVIAHCNFQLRKAESLRDEDFVRQLAGKYGKEVFVRRFETQQYAAERKISIQVAARELRYAWFHELIDSSTARYILTAHHLDDNIETLLMNFFKGTGISGLRGILPKQGKLLRPLLFAGKDELKQFAVSNNLSWMEDSSNESDKYTRNYFRHRVIPLVQTQYPEAIHNLADNIQRFRDIEQLYCQSVELHTGRLLEPRGDEIHIPVLKLKKTQPLSTIIYEISKKFGFLPQQVKDIIGLLDSESGKYIQSPTHRILKNRNWLIISPHPPAGQTTNILIESPEQKVVYENGEISFQMLPVEIEGEVPVIPNRVSRNSNRIALLDASVIQFPLLLRKWRQGDYFYPLGMDKKKKLGRFFIDNKLSLPDKEKVWVLEMNKKIIWVVGTGIDRIDHRFRITAGTRQLLKIESRLA